MAKTSVYQAAGFFLLSQLEASGLKYYGVATTINIAKGDAIHDNGSGYATNGVVSTTGLFLGIASVAADNTNGGNAAINVAVIPPLQHYQFIVPVEENALITQAAVTTHVDLQSVNTIDINDTFTEGWVFTIDEIDVSTAAVAANTYGYAIGHFQSLGTQA